MRHGKSHVRIISSRSITKISWRQFYTPIIRKRNSSNALKSIKLDHPEISSQVAANQAMQPWLGNSYMSSACFSIAQMRLSARKRQEHDKDSQHCAISNMSSLPPPVRLRHRSAYRIALERVRLGGSSESADSREGGEGPSEGCCCGGGWEGWHFVCWFYVWSVWWIPMSRVWLLEMKYRLRGDIWGVEYLSFFGLLWDSLYRIYVFLVLVLENKGRLYSPLIYQYGYITIRNETFSFYQKSEYLPFPPIYCA